MKLCISCSLHYIVWLKVYMQLQIFWILSLLHSLWPFARQVLLWNKDVLKCCNSFASNGFSQRESSAAELSSKLSSCRSQQDSADGRQNESPCNSPVSQSNPTMQYWYSPGKQTVATPNQISAPQLPVSCFQQGPDWCIRKNATTIEPWQGQGGHDFHHWWQLLLLLSA